MVSIGFSATLDHPRPPPTNPNHPRSPRRPLSEAITQCFKEAVALDPSCAMARWGIAYAAGVNYNKPVFSSEVGEAAPGRGSTDLVVELDCARPSTPPA